MHRRSLKRGDERPSDQVYRDIREMFFTEAPPFDTVMADLRELGFVGIAVVIASWIAPHYVSWNLPRALQHAQKALSQPLRLFTLNRLAPSQRYTKDQISPYFWPNGKMPEREDWKHLVATGFHDYKLKISGLVEKPLSFRSRN